MPLVILIPQSREKNLRSFSETRSPDKNQRCFASLNMKGRNSAACSFPSPQQMSYTAPSSPKHASSHCSHVCCCRRVCVLALISRSAAVVDSISAPASDSIRFAESADRPPRCKSERFQLRGSTIRKEPQRCRLDEIGRASCRE